MAKRRQRSNFVAWAVVLVLGIGAVAAVLSATLRAREDPAPASAVGLGEVTVEVLNGCGVDGAARRVANQLRRAGYQVERVSDADHYHYREDIVVLRKGEPAAARAVGRLLEPAVVVEQRIPEAGVHVTVVVGTPHPLVPER